MQIHVQDLIVKCACLILPVLFPDLFSQPQTQNGIVLASVLYGSHIDDTMFASLQERGTLPFCWLIVVSSYTF